MITRIYRVQIDPELRKEFEAKFQQVCHEVVDGSPGLISVSIGKPTRWAPDEYVMVSSWHNVESVQQFAGEDWEKPMIPEDMRRFTKACWLHQYESF
jgi:heme-degrading monooxygenase HmoA